MHKRVVAILAVVGLLLMLDEVPVVRGQAIHVQAGATQEPIASPSLPPSSAPTAVPTPIPTPQPTPVNTYVVGPDDTVASIANYFGLTVKQLVELNPGLEVNPNQLFTGDVLAVAKGGNSVLKQARTAPAPAISAYVSSSGVLWTFDDCEYGSKGVVAHYIQALKAHGVGQAIFFMTGQCYFSRPDLVDLIHASGYEIGNHTYSHPDLTKLGSAQIDAEIRGGPPARYFRPPYGAENDLVRARIVAFGLIKMNWSASGGDSGTEGLNRSCSRILQDLVTTIKPGAIVLLHMFNPNSPGAVDAYLSGKTSC